MRPSFPDAGGDQAARIVHEIEPTQLLVIVVNVGHHREIYQRHRSTTIFRLPVGGPRSVGSRVTSGTDVPCPGGRLVAVAAMVGITPSIDAERSRMGQCRPLVPRSGR